MDVKQAFQSMKSNKPVRFWFCAGDDKGKPRLLFHPEKVPQAEIDAVLKTAKNKAAASGVMKLDQSGELSVITKTAPPAGLAKGVQVVARENNVMPKGINLVTQEILESKELGATYKDEDKKVGWRVPELKQVPGESDADFAARQKRAAEVRESDRTTTKYYDETQRESLEVKFEDGVATNAKGKELDGKRGFVVDPKTAKTYQFKEQHETTADGKQINMHHSSPLAGGAVAGAGHLKFDDGHITKIDDQSGHYKPDAKITYQAVKQLDKEGALERPALDPAQTGSNRDGYREAKVSLLDKKAGITDEQWKEVKGDRAKIVQQIQLNQLKAPLGEKAYADLMLKKPEELKKLIASGKYKNVADLKAALGAVELKKLSDEVKNDPDKLAAKAEELHVDLSTPHLPDNILNNQTVTNFSAGEAGALKTKKSQFLQSKGNEDQMRTKGRMQAELLATVAKRKVADNDPTSAAVRHDAGGSVDVGGYVSYEDAANSQSNAKPPRPAGAYALSSDRDADAEGESTEAESEATEPNYIDVPSEGDAAQPDEAGSASDVDDGADSNYVTPDLR